MIRRAADAADPGCRAALEELCRAYWYPIYAFVRKTGLAHEDAQDLTQEFLSRVVANDRTLGSLDPGLGRFRSFLLVAVRRLMASEWRKAYTQKRGGGAATFSIDESEALERFESETAEDVTPEMIFDRKWAASVMDRTLRRLESHWREKDKPLEALKTYLTDPRGTRPVADLAAQLGTTIPSLKAAIYRLRRLFADLLREEIAATVSEPGEVDDELRYLLTVLAQAK
jgi:RNA polymerase sigma-70 factor (ECF subfamily)